MAQDMSIARSDSTMGHVVLGGVHSSQRLRCYQYLCNKLAGYLPRVMLNAFDGYLTQDLQLQSSQSVDY